MQSTISLTVSLIYGYNKRKEVITMAENKLADLSTEFAVKILNVTGGIKGHYSLANQLERSGTSIGANIREARYAHSKPDFVDKLQISLKECYETEYWIEIAQKANIISEDIAESVLHDCGSIRRMLIPSSNTAKENTKCREKFYKKHRANFILTHLLGDFFVEKKL